jgi:hypothetical protein
MTVRTHTFNGRKYKITIGKMDGLCDTYNKERELVVMADLETKAGLETAIHESLHACSWPASEDTVTVTASDIARFLWRLGYRVHK